MWERIANRTSPSGRRATMFGSSHVRLVYPKSLSTASTRIPRNVTGPELTFPSIVIVGRTSLRQSGFLLVHSGSVAFTVASTTGASSQSYWRIQRCAFGVNKSMIL